MEHRLTLVVAVVALALGCAQERALTYKTPPVASYKTETHQVKIGATAVSVLGATVSPEFFRTADVPPLLGRLFVDADYLSSSPPVVALSHDLWAERFASAPSIIGQEIEIDGLKAIVVAVLPPGFKFPEGTQLWTPRRPDNR